MMEIMTGVGASFVQSHPLISVVVFYIVYAIALYFSDVPDV